LTSPLAGPWVALAPWGGVPPTWSALTPRQAFDELGGLGHELVRLPRLLLARKRRKRTRSADALDDRGLFPAPGATARLAVETAIASLGIGGSDDSGAGRHGSAETGPGDEDADDLVVEQFVLLKKVARRPAPLLFAALLVFALVACRSLLGTGDLLGGALLPASDGTAGLWGMYADSWHAVGTGSTTASPPYLAVLAILSGIFLGNASLALTVIVVLSVPLAAVSAYLVSRPLIESKLVRAWASATYALLPAATGALAQGRIGTAVLAVLLPPLARAAAIGAGLGIRTESAARGARPGWRPVWMAVLMLTLSTAFVPLAWAIAVPLSLAALVHAVVRGGAFGSGGTALRLLGTRVLVILGVPVLVLAPWSLQVLTHPSRLLLEAGVPGFDGPGATPLGLLMVNPGGAGTPPVWLSVGVVLAALAALLRADRRRAVLAAWGAAGAGLLFTVAVAGTEVTPASGGPSVAAWAGPATLLTGVALLAAAAIGADGANARVSGIAFGWRQPVAAVVLATAALAPAAMGLWWAVAGADGPLQRSQQTQLPAFIAEQATTTDRSRTLVLTGPADGSTVGYALVRGGGLTLGQAEATVDAAADDGLGTLAGNLLAGSGGDQAKALAAFGVGYVEVKDPLTTKVRNVLDSTPGITRLSEGHGVGIWQVTGAVATRAVIVPPKSGGTTLPVPSGAHDVYSVIPAGPAGRVLRLAEHADVDWHATLDGAPLQPTTLDGDWAQAFELPAAGGRLDITRSGSMAHTGWIAAQLLLGVIVLVLALPGRRNHNDDDLPEDVAAAQALAAAAEAPLPGSRRARRMAERGEGEADQADAPGVYGAVPGQGGPDGGHPDAAETFADPYQADPYQGGGYQDAYGWEEPGQGADEPAAAPAGQGYEQQPGYEQGYEQPGYDQQAYPQGYEQGYEQPGYDQQGHDPAYQPQPGYEGGQYTDPYAPYGYDQQQYQGYPAEQEQWIPGQPQGEPYYDPNAAHHDGYGNGGHPHHHGSGS
ncbi:family 2 glycosyl transferase, partial [Kitasatospora sp. NPDC059571]|uniref:family 2 glycosyl transferase n=1 Tax=Kitasatospora sp. NPDC059571 TaxID=3346871 RepID=UPI0036A71CC2